VAGHAGGCLCGQVRFRVSADPVGVRACWCRVCQALGGGSATINAVFPSAAITVEGETTDYQSVADSGERMHRKFCPACGTPVFSEAESRPQVTIIRVGALDEPERFAPGGVIWAASAPSWAHLDPGLPTIDGQPPPPARP